MRGTKIFESSRTETHSFPEMGLGGEWYSKSGFSEKAVNFSLREWASLFVCLFQAEKEVAENGGILTKGSQLYLSQPLPTLSLCISISRKVEELLFICHKDYVLLYSKFLQTWLTLPNLRF